MPEHRYVVLHHTGIPEPHYDLMIEREIGGRLMTWRFSSWPIVQPARVERLPDHRRDYLEYEGPVSGNRGHVRRLDAGSCRLSGNEQDLLVHFADDRALHISGSIARWTSTTPASSPAS